MSFDKLSPELVSVLRDRGITQPTDPQKDVIPRILSGKNVLLVAPTGIGKTEAAMLPIFDSIFRTKGGPGIRCLYVTPLRALNRDMLKRMEEYGAALDISVGVRHGDSTQAERNRQSQKAPEILITTPETLQVLFTGKRLREHLKNIEWVVVDEIHELSCTERGAQLGVALERLAELSGEYQRIGLSATVGDVDDVRDFLSGVGREVVLCKHDTRREFEIAVECPLPGEDDAVLQDRLQSDPDILAVMKRARQLMESGRSTLLFVNTRETAEWLAARYRLWDEDFSIDVHHGSLSKENRMGIEDMFKNGELKAVIATSSLELGIDIGSADLVIQYNSPREVSRMIQRAGRAGHRMGEVIRSVILATAPDEIAEALVIARRSDAKELEYFKGRANPFTVLANQLVAMTMSGRTDRDLAYRIFRRSNSFRTLERSDMDGVLEQLKSIKLIFEDENGFRRSKKGMQYFYDNISMIPDERTYLIRDISTRGIVGTLDESFVASFAEPYAMFIAKGRTWRIIEMREEELLVEEAKDVGSVPSWAGSDIPVPFEVAMEVGRMRRKMELERYPGDESSRRRVAEYVDRQKEKWPVPTDKTMTIESNDRLAILNCCFGSRVNETIAKIYSALLTARLGESIGVSADPYRIILELPRSVDRKLLETTFRSIKPGTIEALARLTILNSTYLKWRFVHVAKKFGIIEKGADHRFINFNRLFELHKDTPAYSEAVNMVLWEDLDIRNTELVTKMLADGLMKIEVCGISHIGNEGIVRSKELMQPRRADHTILMALKKRLEDEVLFASCLNCTNQWRVRVNETPPHFKCPRCNGNMVALLKGYERDSIKCIKMKERSEQEKRDALRVSRNANLVNEYGKKAAIVLAGRGIGPDGASRILRGMHVDEDDFLRDIMNAEVLYAKNKRFWD
ncbi:MAG: DEAD/DEAH box helicase [Candidatus Methanoplasma sp.]|jgi:ATP-dependent Lhr-like helicase|nr:DEAD/DEAH box helicase [Candidatus Methanoplasma sp.]